MGGFWGGEGLLAKVKFLGDEYTTCVGEFGRLEGGSCG